MIRHDSISKFFTLLAGLIVVYLSTFNVESVVILYPLILLLSGIVLQFYFQKGIAEVDSLATSGRQVAFYTAFAVAGIALTGAATRYVPAQLAGFPALLYGVLMAISEEIFFRGFLTNFFVQRLTPALGIMASGGIFAVYHLARYGTQMNAMLFVFAGGLILSWAAWKSGRLSPTMIAHSVVNIVAAA